MKSPKTNFVVLGAVKRPVSWPRNSSTTRFIRRNGSGELDRSLSERSVHGKSGAGGRPNKGPPLIKNKNKGSKSFEKRCKGRRQSVSTYKTISTCLLFHARKRPLRLAVEMRY
ncbi:hypothetical protein TNCV_4696111 [Trichonephila clavipes]|nr:hypothetical protein TNCV_4696111 [Trichonephila clavipes]